MLASLGSGCHLALIILAFQFQALKHRADAWLFGSLLKDISALWPHACVQCSMQRSIYIHSAACTLSSAECHIDCMRLCWPSRSRLH